MNIDPDGIVTKLPDNKEPVKILERIEELRVLSAVADAGLLSSAEVSTRQLAHLRASRDTLPLPLTHMPLPA